MTRRLPVPPAPGPLETYCQQFDSLFRQHNQCDRFRRYLEGLLLPAERNKTLTALANTEPVVAAQHPHAQALQWFLSESTWDAQALNAQRLHLLRTEPPSAPDHRVVVIVDETAHRNDGSETATVGRQDLASLVTGRKSCGGFGMAMRMSGGRWSLRSGRTDQRNCFEPSWSRRIRCSCRA